MADYDWFLPTDEEIRQRVERKAWLDSRELIEIPSDDIHSNKKKLGHKVCGCIIMDGYVNEHLLRCYRVETTEGKHKL